MKEFSSKLIALKVDVLQDRRFRASFSPDILQAGAVKGLKEQITKARQTIKINCKYLVPGRWSLVTESSMTTSLIANGCYCEHSSAEERSCPEDRVKVKKV